MKDNNSKERIDIDSYLTLFEHSFTDSIRLGKKRYWCLERSKMRKAILMVVVFLCTMRSGHGQDIFSCLITFEGDYCWEASYLEMCIPGEDNSWQVCMPDKPEFNSSYSLPNVILTDSIGPYPINDTSSLIFKYLAYGNCMCAPVIRGYYKIDSDTLRDFGRIEFSLDNGTTWLDALSDTVVPEIYWITEKPVLTGRIHEWRHFFGCLPWELINDTIYYRFTFISDSIQTNQEGWMLDDLALIDHIEGFSRPEPLDEFRIYPNPAVNSISVSSITPTNSYSVSIFDIHGRILLTQHLNRGESHIDISTLCKGVYFVNVVSGESSYSEILVKK